MGLKVLNLAEKFRTRMTLPIVDLIVEYRETVGEYFATERAPRVVQTIRNRT